MNQAERIQQAVLRSIRSRDLYTEQQVNTMLKVLREADRRVKAELVRIGDGFSCVIGSIFFAIFPTLSERPVSTDRVHRQ